MEEIDSHLITSVADVSDDAAFSGIGERIVSGVAFLPESLPSGDALYLKSDYGDFMKWMATTRPELKLTLPEQHPKLILHSGDIWLPLMYLARDTSVQILLGLITNYLYDRMKGRLKSDRPVVDFSIVYEDHEAQKIKRLDFKGTAEDLAKVMKKFDANNFFDDSL